MQKHADCCPGLIRATFLSPRGERRRCTGGAVHHGYIWDAGVCYLLRDASLVRHRARGNGLGMWRDGNDWSDPSLGIELGVPRVGGGKVLLNACRLEGSQLMSHAHHTGH